MHCLSGQKRVIFLDFFEIEAIISYDCYIETLAELKVWICLNQTRKGGNVFFATQ